MCLALAQGTSGVPRGQLAHLPLAHSHNELALLPIIYSWYIWQDGLHTQSRRYTAALRQNDGEGLPPIAMPGLAQPGPFNLAASLSTRTAKRILNLEFVEMSKVTADATSEQAPMGRPETLPCMV